MLRAAGVAFEIVPAAIDEAVVKRRSRAAGADALACAVTLAEAKARAVAADNPDAVVIGADQILVADGEWFDKPETLEAAAQQLRRLSGRTHTLATAACAVLSGACIWRTESSPEMTMRRLGDAFIAGYIELEGEVLLGSVGAYRIEGPGIQLFSRINGDHFAILGLPLLPLLDFLRQRGLLMG
jgi:septum formation protein